MTELIKVSKSKKGTSIVNARDLYNHLGVKRDFTTWLKARIHKYEFTKNEDFCLLHKIGEQKGSGGHNVKEYAITLDMAKELSMVENNSKGREARRYFIEVDKQAKSITKVPSRKELAQWVVQLEEQNEAANKEISILKPKADLMDRVMDSDVNVDIGQVAKILELGFGRNTLFKKLREEGVFFKNKNEPQQIYIKRGYFKIKEKLIERLNHDNFIVIKVLVTQKGLKFLSEKFDAKVIEKKLIKI